MVQSALLTAATVTDVGVELPCSNGAVYSPDGEIVPVLEVPPLTPFTVQYTLVFVVPATVAVNCCVNPLGTVAAVGATDNVTRELDADVLNADSTWAMAMLSETTIAPSSNVVVLNLKLLPRN